MAKTSNSRLLRELRKCGLQITSRIGDMPDIENYAAVGIQAAKEAGLSRHQKSTALPGEQVLIIWCRSA
jgi:hypothetical protein